MIQLAEKSGSDRSVLVLAFGQLTNLLTRLETRLQRQSRATFLVLCVSLTLGLSLFFFAPRLQVLVQEAPGSFEWARGLDFARQCEQPFDLAAHDPALRWRLLPAALCHLAGLRGHAVFLFPWIGLVLLLAQISGTLADRSGDRVLALFGACLVGTTSGVWTVTTWLGINDAWYLSALIAVVYTRSPVVLVLAGFGGPWVDERFLLGLPLAVLLRYSFPPGAGRKVGIVAPMAGAALYLGIRVLVSVAFRDATSHDFVRSALRDCSTWLPWAPLGWFFGFRAAWCVVLAAVVATFLTVPRSLAIAIAGASIGSLLALTVLAADLTRATPILLPLLLAGIVMLPTLVGLAGARAALGLVLAANLFMPALHVTYTKVSLLGPLPLELMRLLRRSIAF